MRHELRGGVRGGEDPSPPAPSRQDALAPLRAPIPHAVPLPLTPSSSDFVTGFRKRKLARRAAAKADVARRERETRLADRAARRARLREELDLERYDTPPASEGEEEDGRLTAPRLVAAPGGLAATVTVTPVAVDSDLEGGEDEEGDDDEEEKRTAVHALAARPRLAAPPPPAAKKKKRPVKDRRKKKAKKGGGRGK